VKVGVGGMIVVSNLAQDLQVAPQTVKSWLEILERMYLIFRVLPYTQSFRRL
jgi:predicted AAA+ superfamily ATPase